MPNVLSPRDLVSRPDNMDETVSHTWCCLIYRGCPVITQNVFVEPMSLCFHDKL